MSPNIPAPGVQSGGGSTAGAGTLAGGATAGSAIHNLELPDFGAQDSGLQEFTPVYKKHFEDTYGSTRNFESMRPAYEYGSRCAIDTRYKNKSWEQAETDLRSGYEKNNTESTWEHVKASVRHGWDTVVGHGD